MRKFAALAVLLVVSSLYAADAVKSGPQTGEEVPGPFHPLNVTGAEAGKKHCLFCENGPNPVAVVFARTVTPEVTKLIKKLDEATAKNKIAHMGSYVVFCSDSANLEKELKTLAEKEALKSIVLSIDNPVGPPQYKIAKDADVTVVLYTNFSAKANHSFRKGELKETNIDAIAADVTKILPKK